MEIEEAVKHIQRIQAAATRATSYAEIRGVAAQAIEFLKICAGKHSAFTSSAGQSYGDVTIWAQHLVAVLDSFKAHLESGLGEGVSPKRQAQIEVVSDFLEQCRALLETKGVHPAAPIVLAGATLEEFLRNWIEGDGLSLAGKKASIDTYAQVLVAEEKIKKQDYKDITAWAGLRNHAAHGEWEEVSDKQRAAIMLEGINLFMRKYSA